MTWEDPIVNEVRAAREQIAAEHHRDLRALCEYLQAHEREEDHRKSRILQAGFFYRLVSAH